MRSRSVVVLVLVLVLGLALGGCTTAVEQGWSVRHGGPDQTEVTVYNEYVDVMQQKHRIARVRPPTYDAMYERIHAMDVRAGKLRQYAWFDIPFVWGAYDRSRRELQFELETLPFNAERAYHAHANTLEAKVSALEERLEGIARFHEKQVAKMYAHRMRSRSLSSASRSAYGTTSSPRLP